jgi:hypothetical protein
MNPGAVEVSRTRSNQSWFSPTSYKMGTGFLSGRKAADEWRSPPAPSKTEV